LFVQHHVMNIQKMPENTHDFLSFMQRLVVIVLAAGTSHICFSQYHAIGIHGSLDYGYRSLASNSTTKEVELAERNFLEYPSLGVTVGLNYAYRQKQIAFLFEGQYSIRGYDENNTGQPQNSTFIQPDYQIFYYYRFIDAGFNFAYYLNENKLQLFLTAGMRLNHLLSGEERRVDFFQDGTMQSATIAKTDEALKTITTQLTAGIGLHYQHTESICYQVIPSFNYGLQSITTPPINERLFSGSLRVGISYLLPTKVE
jgi:hypothetical protein